MRVVWLHGAVRPDEEPAVRAQRGVYETLRWDDGPPPGLAHHAARWRLGLATLHLPQRDLPSLLQDAAPFLTPGTPWRVRLTAFPGGIELAWRPLEADELAPRPWTLRSLGAVAARSAALGPCKSTDLHATRHWREQARAHGDDDALLRGPDGQWAEATTANLVCGLDDGRIATPWPASMALPGTTLASLAALLPIAPMRLDVTMRPHIRWAVLTNAIVLLRAIRALDGTSLAPPPTEILALRDRLARAPRLSR